jgi:hypothetical protein
VSAIADEELGPKFTFEIADLLRERRSSKVKPLRGPTEMQFLGNGDEVGQLPELHAVDGRAVGERRGLPVFGQKSWTRDEDKG